VTAELEQAVLAAIDDQRIVEDLERLVRIPSVDGAAAESAALVTVTWPGGVFASGALPAGDPLMADTLQAATDVL
jgi:hypothetical protein